MFNPLSWVALAACWIGAAASFLTSRQRKALLDAQTGLDSIAAMNWRQFELLVGEAFPAPDIRSKKPAWAAQTVEST